MLPVPHCPVSCGSCLDLECPFCLCNTDLCLLCTALVTLRVFVLTLTPENTEVLISLKSWNSEKDSCCEQMNCILSILLFKGQQDRL